MSDLVDQAEIHWMAQSVNAEERREAKKLLCENFTNLPDKNQAWSDLLWFASNKDSFVRWGQQVRLT